MFHRGMLLESTGLYGKSSLREVTTHPCACTMTVSRVSHRRTDPFRHVMWMWRRQVTLNTGAVVRKFDFERKYFGEGITVFKNRLYSLTWKSGKAFVHDLETFNVLPNVLFSVFFTPIYASTVSLRASALLLCRWPACLGERDVAVSLQNQARLGPHPRRQPGAH